MGDIRRNVTKQGRALSEKNGSLVAIVLYNHRESHNFQQYKKYSKMIL